MEKCVTYSVIAILYNTLKERTKYLKSRKGTGRTRDKE